ncbi:hypothetical protein [Arthrobacter sp. NicSoilB11]|uniref:hypothetical protein n=1 Tax=Arthrobacter sp. NicSoilB11 TaxID=2830999 RepID=UPI001CC4560F|nr:hypothetical protein [Arthrobacter sp. NicSoilB11]BCW77508.1 hypothetical protein NicSoilB11_38330 [Arthrobacter sp. NicSoilB11]
MTSKLNEALNTIWQTEPERRCSAASKLLPQLDRAAIDLLTAWDCSASLGKTDSGRLVEVANSALPHAIEYTDVPWARTIDERFPTRFHSLASLLVVAQYARDLLDSDALTFPEERESRIRRLSAETGIDEERVVRLLSSFSSEVRNMA